MPAPVISVSHLGKSYGSTVAMDDVSLEIHKGEIFGLIQVVAQGLPTTHAVSLMQGVWDGSGWGAHWGSVLGLILVFGVCTGLSTKVFRWE